MRDDAPCAQGAPQGAAPGIQQAISPADIDSVTRIREFFKNSADAIILLRDGKFHEFNPAALCLFGYAENQADLQGAVPHQISPRHQPDGRLSQEKMEAMHAIVREKGSHRFEWQYSTRDHGVFWGEVTVTAVQADGVEMMYAMVRDISERKQTEQALRLSAQVFENSHDGIIILDAQWRVYSVNAAYTTATGFRAQDVIGREDPSLCVDEQDLSECDAIRAAVYRTGHWQGELWGRRGNGEAFPAWASISAVRDDGRLVNFIVIFYDISERKASEERIRHLSEHDFLTGLPNRVLLLDRLQQAIANARRNRSKLAVLFLDLDHFKNINDSLGHHIGDKLLQLVAERLKKCVRSNDTVSRQGGDEFVVMLTEIGGIEQVGHIAANILQAMGMPCHIEEHMLSITTCVGISLYPEDGQDMDVLLRNADTAMYHAKEHGRNNYQFFNHAMNVRIVARMTLENQLRTALEQNQFFLEYQPEIEIASGRIVGVEALLRWRHPEGHILAPAHFLQTAEACGLIVPIGDWVLLAACRQAKLWQDEGTPMMVGVNLSVIQFRQKDFLQKVREVLRQTALAPQLLELEITESVLIDTAGSAMDTMHALRAMGVVLAVDDFGTGYSSLSYLKHFPVDKLKIDQSFVRDLDDDANDAAIIRAILIMAKSLNLKVVAEGVETIEQLNFLRTQGCDEFQGHYFMHPVLAAELPHFPQPH
ncbi:EAL domain-containing protein [Janthinobacterium sp. 17J80-10]|uniref:putative bifunctional diguanylate cyclase/phosphodiesterase n=1 Tax=Janthinobacterium sp. 17J80-10 TaxID=2497863 RepID=UPI0013E8EE38|nr:EAL domain-containing protein [Janthinobacterium sp. 17J80-10]